MIYFFFPAEVLAFLQVFPGLLGVVEVPTQYSRSWPLKKLMPAQGPPHMGTILVPRARGTPALNPSPADMGAMPAWGGIHTTSLKAYHDGNGRPPHLGRPVARGVLILKPEGLSLSLPKKRPKASISSTTRKSLAPPHGHHLGAAREGDQKEGQEDQGSAFGGLPQIA